MGWLTDIGFWMADADIESQLIESSCLFSSSNDDITRTTFTVYNFLDFIKDSYTDVKVVLTVPHPQLQYSDTVLKPTKIHQYLSLVFIEKWSHLHSFTGQVTLQ